MSKITSTNIRVGPGVYSFLRWLSEKTGLPIGVVTNMTVGYAIITIFSENMNNTPIPSDIQQMMFADFVTGLGEVIKKFGPNIIQDQSLRDFYDSILRSSKKEEDK